MTNEQKLRNALLALVGVRDDIEDLEGMKALLLPNAIGNEDVQVCIGAIQVLIDTKPDADA